MKMRSDFVTNSSSSSFILARKGGLSERQKEALVDFVEHTFLGESTLASTATDEEVDRYIEKHYLDDYEEKEQMVKEAHGNGYDVSLGIVSFECADYNIGGLYQGIWRALSETADDGTFLTLDGDLSY